MKKLLIFSLCVLLLCCCNSFPEKSIFEPLTDAELNKAVSKDAGFYDFYFYCNDYLKYIVTDAQRIYYYDITYNELFNYGKYLDKLEGLPEEEFHKRAFKKNNKMYKLMFDL